MQGHGIKTERKKDPEPIDRRHGHVRGSEGHGDGGVQARRVLRPALPDQGHRAAQARPRRVLVTDVKHVTKFYCDVLGFRVSDWMGDFFSFLRCGPDHHTINLMQTGRTGTSTPPSSCATGRTCRPPAII